MSDMKGKIIVIEGTDCSGKATQTELLVKRLNNENLISLYFRVCAAKIRQKSEK